ncbi:MAG: helix-turn-helix domain-containing protein [Myxococcales bacterium]|nr:helix-turn-helix domain-containing protein [Myxococcales bacterium]
MATTLDELAAALRRIEEYLAQPAAAAPLLLKFPDAATRLGISITTLREMVARGELRTATVGRRAMVPLAELERVATPDEARAAQARKQRVKAWVSIEKGRAKR